MTHSVFRLAAARVSVLGLLALAGAASYGASKSVSQQKGAAPHAAPQEVRSIEGVTEYRLENGLQVL
ncbi:MAG TPA: hypothetical protein VGD63_08415, partial [Steroidobacteraceae bacterium]